MFVLSPVLLNSPLKMNQHWHRCMEQTDSCQRKGGEEPTGRKKVKGLAKNIHEVCPEGIKPCNMKNTDIY